MGSSSLSDLVIREFVAYVPKKLNSMKIGPVIRISLLIIFTGFSGIDAKAQDTGFQLIDFVDLPADLTEHDPIKDSEGRWYIEFRETWHINPEGYSILKTVDDYEAKIHDAPPASADSIQKMFASLMRQLPEASGTLQLQNLTYEFMLLDPHMMASGNIAYSEPDSMDVLTKKLQRELITLVKALSKTMERYDLYSQMLSVHFHEDWIIDPVSFQITKRVRGITPVIWQRRQTTDGEPINDAETGLPVYYKNSLNRIDLRNP